MQTADIHPPRAGELAAALDHAHHYHGPLDRDDFGLAADTLGIIEDERAGGCGPLKPAL